MAEKIVMPRLGLAMEEGKIARWLKEIGDSIEEGEMLLEVESDKVVMEVESTDSGILAKILVAEGERAKVNSPIAIITAPGEEYVEEEEQEIEKPLAICEEKKVDNSLKSVTDGNRILATPAAKAVARARGVDLSLVKSKKGKRIVKSDVYEFLEDINTSNPYKEEGFCEEYVKLTGKRAVSAKRMAESSLSTAPVTYTCEVDAENIIALRKLLKDEIQKETGVKITYTDILVKLVAVALTKHPECNAWYDEEQGIMLKQSVNMGIAVDAPDGLVVPVIKDVQNKSLVQIAVERNELVQKGREGRLRMEDITGGTFTISNLGTRCVGFFSPIINIPQVCIIGVGKMEEKPIISGEEIKKGTVLHLSLVFDHRAMEGVPAAEFFDSVTKLVKEPVRIIK